jgi:hypothetical protein
MNEGREFKKNEKDASMKQFPLIYRFKTGAALIFTLKEQVKQKSSTNYANTSKRKRLCVAAKCACRQAILVD